MTPLRRVLVGVPAAAAFGALLTLVFREATGMQPEQRVLSAASPGLRSSVVLPLRLDWQNLRQIPEGAR
jgi:hypothetical protein